MTPIAEVSRSSLSAVGWGTMSTRCPSVATLHGQPTPGCANLRRPTRAGAQSCSIDLGGGGANCCASPANTSRRPSWQRTDAANPSAVGEPLQRGAGFQLITPRRPGVCDAAPDPPGDKPL